MVALIAKIKNLTDRKCFSSVFRINPPVAEICSIPD